MDLFFAFYAVFAGFAVVAGQDDSALTRALRCSFTRWQPRAKYKIHLDPTSDEVKKLVSSCRRSAKGERVLFHYNGHGVPRPTSNGTSFGVGFLGGGEAGAPRRSRARSLVLPFSRSPVPSFPRSRCALTHSRNTKIPQGKFGCSTSRTRSTSRCQSTIFKTGWDPRRSISSIVPSPVRSCSPSSSFSPGK